MLVVSVEIGVRSDLFDGTSRDLICTDDEATWHHFVPVELALHEADCGAPLRWPAFLIELLAFTGSLGIQVGARGAFGGFTAAV